MLTLAMGNDTLWLVFLLELPEATIAAIIWNAELYSGLEAIFTNEVGETLWDFLVQTVPVFNFLAFLKLTERN